MKKLLKMPLTAMKKQKFQMIKNIEKQLMSK